MKNKSEPVFRKWNSPDVAGQHCSLLRVRRPSLSARILLLRVLVAVVVPELVTLMAVQGQHSRTTKIL
eukprot:472100-Rhodomonas_salina.6